MQFIKQLCRILARYWNGVVNVNVKPTESTNSSAALRISKNFLRNLILEIAYNENGALDQVIIIEQKTQQKGALN